jgi:diadenylate cyclase
MYTRTAMPDLLASVLRQLRPSAVLDVLITALLIYWLLGLIRGTRAVPLVIGVFILFLVYGLAQFLELQLLTQILRTGAVVGLFALVVIFQPELRRALEQIGRIGSLAWLFTPVDPGQATRVAHEIAVGAGALSAEGHGALIVLERETGLEEIAESGVMLHADLSADLLRTIFTPRTALHDGAVIVRGATVVAAGALLPLAETTAASGRIGTRHRAALGITEETDAVVVVVSEENRQISLVERARIIRNLTPAQLERSLVGLLTEGRPARSLLGRVLARPTGGPLPRPGRPSRLWGRGRSPARSRRDDEGSAATVHSR